MAKLPGSDKETIDIGCLAIEYVAKQPSNFLSTLLAIVVVLSGEIYKMMDDKVYLLKAGDTVVKQGTNHAWSNRGTEPCLIAFILVDAVK